MRPDLIKSNIHKYIDYLVDVSNDIQEYARYSDGHVLDHTIDAYHEREYSDDEINEIAESAPGIIFVQSLSGGGDYSMMHKMNKEILFGEQREECPV